MNKKECDAGSVELLKKIRELFAREIQIAVSNDDEYYAKEFEEVEKEALEAVRSCASEVDAIFDRELKSIGSDQQLPQGMEKTLTIFLTDLKKEIREKLLVSSSSPCPIKGVSKDCLKCHGKSTTWREDGELKECVYVTLWKIRKKGGTKSSPYKPFETRPYEDIAKECGLREKEGSSKSASAERCGDCRSWVRGGIGAGRGGGTCLRWKIPKYANNVLAPTNGCWEKESAESAVRYNIAPSKEPST